MKKKIALAILLAALLANLPARNGDVWVEALEKFSTVLSLVEANYYQPVDSEKLVFAAIRGVLDSLDPHSYFLDPDSFSRMREEYTGKYYGLGIQIQKQEERLVVISPIEGGPASRLGILPGDVISHINGESTKPLSSFDAMQKLRGPKGTEVTITIVREGLDAPFDLTIERAEIPLRSVPYAFMLNEEVGYLFIRNFAETTTEEFEEKMGQLVAQGMKSLVLDLRGNTGGPFFKSIEIADEFLPRGAAIVSIQGRNRFFNREFRAQRDGQYENLPLVILINRGSASASEIVSGAIMDNDRGLIVGEASWGKGLVQTVFPLGENLALALTTAQYLTPSGRSIQRDYGHLDDYILYKQSPEERREVRYTARGRKVLGQGGISPDFEVPFSRKFLTLELMNRGAFFTYARRLAGGQTPLAKAEGIPGVKIDEKAFVVDERIVEDFRAYLKSVKIDFEEDRFKEAEEEIKRELTREIYSSLWGIEAGIAAYQKSDAAVRKAIEVMPEAARFLAANNSP